MDSVKNQTKIEAAWIAFKRSFTTMDRKTMTWANYLNQTSKFKTIILPIIALAAFFWFINDLPLQLQTFSFAFFMLWVLATVAVILLIGSKFMSWVSIKIYHYREKHWLMPSFYFWSLTIIFGIVLGIAMTTILTAAAMIIGVIIFMLIGKLGR